MRAGSHPGRGRTADVGGAHLQFVLQVVPPVPGHDVEQQQAAADDASLAAGMAPGRARTTSAAAISSGTLSVKPNGLTSRQRAGQRSQPPLDRALTPGYGKHVHASVGQRGDALHQRAEPPAAVDH